MRTLILYGVALALTSALASPAATEKAEESNEYVVYVAKLNLRAEPSPKADVIAVLRVGERVMATEAELAYVSENESWDFWREVRAGDKVGWVADWYILPADTYDAAEKVDGLDETGEPYVVWVSNLNLRRNPGTAAKKLTTLAAGTTAADSGYQMLWLAGDLWRLVRAGDKVGWVADRCILPAALASAFKEADELGKAGDAEGMVAAVTEGGLKGGFDWSCFDISPDRRKIFVLPCWEWGLDDIPQWGGGYPNGGRVGTGFPVLYFVTGRGLVEYFRAYTDICGRWFRDSRYYVYTENAVVEFGFGATLMLLDTETWRREDIGFVATPEYGFEFANGYVVWFGEELIEDRPPYLEEESYAPVLWAYDMKLGERVRILEADLSTMGTEVADAGLGTKFYEVKMVPAGLCPKAVAGSDLYLKYAHKTAEVEDRTYCMYR